MTALVGAALERLRGGDPAFADGLRIARRRAGAILGYSLIAATVGVLLSLLRGQRQQGIGALLAGMGGLAWGVATFLVLPVLAAKGIGPVAAIRESAGILRKTWGEQLTGTFGMGAAFAVALFLTLLATIGLVGLAGQAQLPALAAPILLVGGTCLVVLVVLNTTLMGIYRGAVYLYAEQGQVAPQFDRSVITQAFAPRSK